MKLINKFVDDAICPYCGYEFLEESGEEKYELEGLSDEGNSINIICPDCNKECEVQLRNIEYSYRTYQLEGEEEKDEEEVVVLEYPGQLFFNFV
jgi:rubredoxin